MKKITVPRIGDGTDENPYRPDTEEQWWKVVEENDNEFVIEILG